MNQPTMQKILVIGPAWVGDMVMAQTLFIELKRRQPDCLIDVLAPAWTFPLLERMPEVRRAIEMPVGHGELLLSTRWRLGRELKAEGYDRSIVLPNSLKSALVPFFAGIPQRTGWRGEMRYGLLNDVRILDKAAYPLMIERFLALADVAGDLPSPLPFPRLVVEARQCEATVEKFGLNNERAVLALCPGAEFGPAKQWPAEHYRQVATTAIESGWQIWLFGSGKDRGVTAEILEGIAQPLQAHCFNLAGETALAEAVDLLAQCSAVVSNDSGLMHIAAALGRPLVAVYGSTSPGFTPPLGESVEVVRSKLDCAPCFQRECPLGHTHCLKQLEPGQVTAALSRLPIQFPAGDLV